MANSYCRTLIINLARAVAGAIEAAQTTLAEAEAKVEAKAEAERPEELFVACRRACARRVSVLEALATSIDGKLEELDARPSGCTSAAFELWLQQAYETTAGAERGVLAADLERYEAEHALALHTLITNSPEGGKALDWARNLTTGQKLLFAASLGPLYVQMYKRQRSPFKFEMEREVIASEPDEKAEFERQMFFIATILRRDIPHLQCQTLAKTLVAAHSTPATLKRAVVHRLQHRGVVKTRRPRAEHAMLIRQAAWTVFAIAWTTPDVLETEEDAMLPRSAPAQRVDAELTEANTIDAPLLTLVASAAPGVSRACSALLAGSRDTNEGDGSRPSTGGDDDLGGGGRPRIASPRRRASPRSGARKMSPRRGARKMSPRKKSPRKISPRKA